MIVNTGCRFIGVMRQPFWFHLDFTCGYNLRHTAVSLFTLKENKPFLQSAIVNGLSTDTNSKVRPGSSLFPNTHVCRPNFGINALRSHCYWSHKQKCILRLKLCKREFQTHFQLWHVDTSSVPFWIQLHCSIKSFVKWAWLSIVHGVKAQPRLQALILLQLCSYRL